MTDPKLYEWPDRAQIRGALHSNGAMLIRSWAAQRYKIPESMSFDVTEAVRERSFDFPILFVPDVLGNFAVTIKTARSQYRVDSVVTQAMLTASFFKNVPFNLAIAEKIAREYRANTRSTDTLIWAHRIVPSCENLKYAIRKMDVLLFFAWCIKHPVLAVKIARQIKTSIELWNYLDLHTQRQTFEAKKKVLLSSF